MMNIKELIKNNKYICNSDNKNYMEITEFKDNKISICPQGGGFVKSIDIDNGKFIDDVVSEKIKFTNDMPMEWKKVKLYHDHWIADNRIDLAHYIEGFVHEYKWNGWSMPMVELDQIKKFNELLNFFKVNDINFFLVQSPVTKQFYESHDQEQLLSILGDEPYLDFNNKLSLNDSLHFYDEHHLNQYGVVKFNDALIQTIKVKKLLEK